MGPGAKSLAIFAFLAVLIVGAEGIVLWSRRQQRNAQAAMAAEADAVSPPVTLSLDEVPSFTGADEPPPEEVVVDDPAAHVPLLALDGVPDAIITSALEGHRLIAVVGSGDLPATNDVSLALGQELAEQGLSTLVVEGDMSRPTMATRLGIRSQAGLTDVLSGGSSLERTLRQTTVNGLNVLPSRAGRRSARRPDRHGRGYPISCGRFPSGRRGGGNRGVASGWSRPDVPRREAPLGQFCGGFRDAGAVHLMCCLVVRRLLGLGPDLHWSGRGVAGFLEAW